MTLNSELTRVLIRPVLAIHQTQKSEEMIAEPDWLGIEIAPDYRGNMERVIHFLDYFKTVDPPTWSTGGPMARQPGCWPEGSGMIIYSQEGEKKCNP